MTETKLSFKEAVELANEARNFEASRGEKMTGMNCCGAMPGSCFCNEKTTNDRGISIETPTKEDKVDNRGYMLMDPMKALTSKKPVKSRSATARKSSRRTNALSTQPNSSKNASLFSEERLSRFRRIRAERRSAGEQSQEMMELRKGLLESGNWQEIYKED